MTGTQRLSFSIECPTEFRQGPPAKPMPRRRPAWLTQNDVRRMHWAEHGRRVAQWKTLAMLAARPRPKTPMPVRVAVHAWPEKSGRMFDGDAIAPSVKACIDGLVLAGVLVDDTPTWVGPVTYQPPERVAAGRYRLRLELIPIPDEGETP